MRYSANLFLIFHMGDDGMIHWYPDDPNVPRCGKRVSKDGSRIEYENVEMDKTCFVCMTYLFNAIIRGQE